MTVRIGHETEVEEMAGTSVTYGSSGTVFGGMGVVGPTRMDTPGRWPTWRRSPCTSAEFSATAPAENRRLSTQVAGQAWHATTAACSE